MSATKKSAAQLLSRYYYPARDKYEASGDPRLEVQLRLIARKEAEAAKEASK